MYSINKYLWQIPNHDLSRLYSFKTHLCKLKKKIITCFFYFPSFLHNKHILTFMGTLQVGTKWNYRSWIQIVQIKFLFLVFSFWKQIALVYFLKIDWSYTFFNQNFNLNFFWSAWNLDFHEVKIAVTLFVMHCTHVSRHFEVYCIKQTKNA